MSKDFANTDSKSTKRTDPKSTNPFTEPTSQTHRGLADEGTIEMQEFGRNEQAKAARAAKPTTIADAEHQAGDGGRARPRVAS